MEYSITEALAKLGLLDKRINKEIEALAIADIVKGNQNIVVKNNAVINDFESRAKNQYQSINDLINQRNKIQIAIMLSNSQTKIKINDKEITVIAAITYKETIKYKINLLDHIKRNQLMVNKDLERGNNNVELNLQKLLETQFGNKDANANSKDMEEIITNYNKFNQYKLIDPLKINDIIEKLDKEIDEFVTKIDYILSESNAKTKIYID